MPWWDHEELKEPAARSDRYKVHFPEEYPPEVVQAAQARLELAAKPIAVLLAECVRDTAPLLDRLVELSELLDFGMPRAELVALRDRARALANVQL